MQGKLRVGTPGPDFWYVHRLYRPMRDAIDRVRWPTEVTMSADAFRPHLAEVDLLHVNNPEFSFGEHPEQHAAVIDALKQARVPIVWTCHDLFPHSLPPEAGRGIMQLWSQAADGVIHQSQWGMDLMRRTYEFNPQAIHRVILHPAWGGRVRPNEGQSRAAAESHFELPPAGIRILIHGGPRRGKDVQLAMDALAACHRSDLQLCVFSVVDETVPEDGRIIARQHRYMAPDEFKLLLQAADVFLLPFREGESTLTTGLPFDAITLGKPMIISDFGYLREIAGDAGILYGTSREELTACLTSLDRAELAGAAAASSGLRKRYSVGPIAEEIVEFLEEVAGVSGLS